MKNQILLVIALIYAQSAFATYVRTTFNGGPNGFFETSDVRTGNNRTISCKDPGTNPCPKIFVNNQGDDASILDKVNNLLNYAYLQIESGILNGNHSENNLMVTWSAESPLMSNSEIKIE